MAESRGGAMSAQQQEIYALRLSEFDKRDVIAVLSTIADTPREQWESAIPDRGTIIGKIIVQQRKRIIEERHPLRLAPHVQAALDKDKRDMKLIAEGKGDLVRFDMNEETRRLEARKQQKLLERNG